jgi:flagellar hook-basal body complex protein FliE
MALLDAISGFGGGNLFGMGKAGGAAGGGSQLDLVKDMQKAIDSMSPKNVAGASKDAQQNMLSGATGLDSARSVFAEIPGGGGADSFVSTLSDLVDSVDAKAKAAEQANTDIMTGKSDNIHQTMISMQEASISFDLLVQVRNKLVDSYKELSRISV